MENWIETKNELPNFDTEVLVVYHGDVWIGELHPNNDEFRLLNGLGVCESTRYVDKEYITHWMQFPEPPNA